MTACDTVIRSLCIRLKDQYVQEYEMNICLSEEISAALAHYGPNIQALDVKNPLDANFIALQCQLAMRRIEQFRRRIAERAHCLNQSQAVQEALHILGVLTAQQCDLAVNLGHDSTLSKEEWSQQINTAFLHLMNCSNSLQRQLAELMRALEAWMPFRNE